MAEPCSTTSQGSLMVEAELGHRRSRHVSHGGKILGARRSPLGRSGARPAGARGSRHQVNAGYTCDGPAARGRCDAVKEVDGSNAARELVMA